MIDDGRINSLRLKIGKADTAKIQEIASEILKIGTECPEDILEALSKKINSGIYLRTDLAAELIALFKHRGLFEANKAALLRDPKALVTLLCADFPDSAIERQLCELLSGSDLRHRTPIVESLHDHGSRECLSYLSALSYDFSPRYKTAQLLSDKLASPPPLEFEASSLEAHAKYHELRADLAFGKLLWDAIEAVRDRDAPGFDGRVTTDIPRSSPRMKLAYEHLEQAKRHLGSDLSAALNKLRMAFESLLKCIIEERNLPVNKPKPLDEFDFGELATIVRAELVMPKTLARHLDYAISITTAGSHDQGRQHTELVTARMVDAQFDSFDLLEKHLQAAGLVKARKQ